MRTAGISLAWIGLTLGAVGCTTGNQTGTVTNGIVCSAQLTITGSFAQSTARPVDNPDGCWPIGMWTFQAALVDGSNTCQYPPTLLPQYQFQGTATTDVDGNVLESFMYVTDPTVNATVKANEGGSGSCEGDLNIYSTDGTQVLSLKPEIDTTAANSTISGSGEYRVYKTNQWAPDLMM